MEIFSNLIKDNSLLDFSEIENVENFLETLKKYSNVNIPFYINLVESGKGNSEIAKSLYEDILLAQKFIDLYFNPILSRYFSNLDYFSIITKKIKASKSPKDYTYVKINRDNKTYWRVFVERELNIREYEAIYFWDIILDFGFDEDESDINLFLLLFFKSDNRELLRKFYIEKSLKNEIKA